MNGATPGQAALARWRGSEIIEVDAAQLTPDNLDELWQSFESKPHYDADRNVDGLAVYADHGREVALFGEWVCRRVDDGLPFTLGDAEFRKAYQPADAAAPESAPVDVNDLPVTPAAAVLYQLCSRWDREALTIPRLLGEKDPRAQQLQDCAIELRNAVNDLRRDGDL